MPFTATVHHDRPYLLVGAAGPASLTDLCALADFIAALSGRAGERRALIDLQAVELSLSFTEHLQLGAWVADKLARLDQVATVVRPEDRKGTSEKAAQKFGLHLRTFTRMDEAVAWLDEDRTDSA
jgi:hypothetical protein